MTRTGCIDQPPPQPDLYPGDFAGPEDGCPEDFELCMTLEASGRLERYLVDLQRWADQAWLGCASEEDLDDENETDHDSDHGRGAGTPGQPSDR